MTLSEALTEALDYESRIQDLYLVAAADSTVPEAKAFFEFMAADEGRHVAFIDATLKRVGSGDASPPDAASLDTSLPHDVGAAVARARQAMGAIQDDSQLSTLERALRAEEETSAFYQRLVATLPASETLAFKRLQEIEDGHTAIVRAELDSVTNSGFWFDVRVFDMEE
ncbi:MAG: hypothetical protein JXM71_03415 [Spirochaetales bacterium]|nr:hypothetical protein [Spirochaetales bacterium]